MPDRCRTCCADPGEPARTTHDNQRPAAKDELGWDASRVVAARQEMRVTDPDGYVLMVAQNEPTKQVSPTRWLVVAANEMRRGFRD